MKRKTIALFAVVTIALFAMSVPVAASSSKSIKLKAFDDSVFGTIDITDVLSSDIVNDARSFFELGTVRISTDSLITYNLEIEGVFITDSNGERIHAQDTVINVTNAVLKEGDFGEFPVYESGYTIQFLKAGTYRVGMNGEIGYAIGAGLYPIVFEVSDVTAALPAIPTTAQAKPTASSVYADGIEKAFDAYNINGNNYFKLRDLAQVMRGTDGQFEVTWDSNRNAINMVDGKAYTSVGGEMSAGDGVAKTATLTTSPIYLDGKLVKMKAYNINGNNYFMLRDVGKTIGFSVVWDAARSSIVIDSTQDYTE